MIKAAVVGWPIAQSYSPRIHGYWLKKYAIDGSYEKFAVPVDKFETTLEQLMLAGYAGVNVTLPHKERALKFCDALSLQADSIGAVNTLTFNDGKIYGDNTDGIGFLNSFKPNLIDWRADLAVVLVFGAGGAARAIVDALIRDGVGHIMIANRTLARAQKLANHFGRNVRVVKWNQRVMASMDASMIINTTSLGMLGQPPLEFSGHNLTPKTIVIDIIYNPLDTMLLCTAQACGCQTLNGLGMLLHQAVPAFLAWFGRKPGVDQALRDFILAH